MGSKHPEQESRGTSTSFDNLNIHVHFLPYQSCPLQKLAQIIINQNLDKLPDLSHVVILLSQSQAAPLLRKKLLQCADDFGYKALLGPHINSLKGWISQFTLPDNLIINDDVRELMLVEALMKHPQLYGQGSPWNLASSLITLFDELTRQHVALPKDLAKFQQQLSKGYGINKLELSALGQEATLVHTLWRAMQKQLHALQGIDELNAHILKLHKSIHESKTITNYYLAGQFDFSCSEWQWLEQLSGNHSVTIVLQDDVQKTETDISAFNRTERPSTSFNQELRNRINSKIHIDIGSDELNECLNYVYQWKSQPLKDRAVQCKNRFPNDPIKNHIAIFEAPFAEAEALAIDIQVRRWLTLGISHIGIVTENRRLARRVRALLERSEVTLNDAAGWALSTTSAATIIEKWLQCIEENFHYQVFLDLLKSPFLFPDYERDEFLALVYRFEQGIILQENIANGMDRYLSHIDLRMQRLPKDLALYYQDIPPLLQIINKAAQALFSLCNSSQQQAGQYLSALINSLTELGIYSALQNDDAGSRVLAVIEQLANSVSKLEITMNWADFRAWLGRSLEQAYFQPANTNGPIQLMSLLQSDLQSFDAVIIAAAEQEYLPGAADSSPFFNDSVRTNLGLRSLQSTKQNKFYYFRRLLQCTPFENKPRVLITRRCKDNTEDIIASPWLEAIQSFHRQAYNSTLVDDALVELVANPQSQICNADAPLPKVEPAYPRATIAANLLPTTITASTYQQLVNCPYQFFAARCLKLTAPESVKELLEKSDYGERVHLCLQAFHTNTLELPGPFDKSLTEQNRQEAIDLLTQISSCVFSKDIEDNYIHRGWLRRWQELIPVYIDWQTQQSQQWQVESVEREISNLPLANAIKLSGRLDRIDTDSNQVRIIDYKTGFVPKQEDVESGEAVQLPFYAMLADSILTSEKSVTSVDYLSLTAGKFGINSSLSGEQLYNLKSIVATRLADMITAINSGKELPAWGDSKTCEFCQMQGLCRKQAWDVADA